MIIRGWNRIILNDGRSYSSFPLSPHAFNDCCDAISMRRNFPHGIIFSKSAPAPLHGARIFMSCYPLERKYFSVETMTSSSEMCLSLVGGRISCCWANIIFLTCIAFSLLPIRAANTRNDARKTNAFFSYRSSIFRIVAIHIKDNALLNCQFDWFSPKHIVENWPYLPWQISKQWKYRFTFVKCSAKMWFS